MSAIRPESVAIVTDAWYPKIFADALQPIAR
jgi:hypothetical protein